MKKRILRAAKRNKRGIRKRAGSGLWGLGALLLLGLPFSCLGAQETTRPLQGAILKVGKADAIVLWQGEKALVIDAGEEDDGEEVVEFLKEQKIQEVDTLIITHFDKDHVGGADTLLEEMPVREVLVPAYEGDHAQYEEFLKALKAAGLEETRVEEEISFSFGNATVTVEPPLSYEVPENGEEMDNNFSLLTTLVHGNVRLFFTGDMEEERTREWLSLEGEKGCDFLKLPHHGVYQDALPDLLDATNPSYVAICDSDKNPAGEKTLELLSSRDIQAYETRFGNIHLISDGNQLEVSQ